MFAQKPPAPSDSKDSHRKQLELLYARRLAIDSLIQSLVAYDRTRAKWLETLNKKTGQGWLLDRTL